MENNKLLETIVSHLLDIKESQKRIETRVSSLEDGQKRMEGNVNSLENSHSRLAQTIAKISESVAKIENIHGDKISALFDAREVQNDANTQIIQQLDRIESKIQSHDVQISVLDRTKTTRRKAK